MRRVVSLASFSIVEGGDCLLCSVICGSSTLVFTISSQSVFALVKRSLLLACFASVLTFLRSEAGDDFRTLPLWPVVCRPSDNFQMFIGVGVNYVKPLLKYPPRSRLSMNIQGKCGISTSRWSGCWAQACRLGSARGAQARADPIFTERN